VTHQRLFSRDQYLFEGLVLGLGHHFGHFPNPRMQNAAAADAASAAERPLYNNQKMV